MIRREAPWAALLGAAAAALYLTFTTKFYVFEGLARAMPIEAGRFPEVFKGNYLLYGFLGWCFHNALRLLGAEPMAVVSLQAMDCLLGAAGVSLFFLTLRRLEVERSAAAAWAAALAVCLGHWLWSTDAQNYIFSSFVLNLNLHFLVRDATGARVRPWVLGALHALAVTAHIVNGLFGVVVLWHLRRRYGKQWLEPALEYVAAVALGAVGAYAFVLLAFVRPPSAADALHWFYGSLNKGAGGLYWHGRYDLYSLKLWLKMTVNIFASFKPEYRRAGGGAAAEALLAAARGLLLALALRLAWTRGALGGARRHSASVCAVWLLVYAAVFVSWEPMTMVYRVSDLPAMLLLLALGAKDWRWPVPAALACCLAGGNFLAEVYPRSISQNNALLTRMEFLRGATPENAWIATPESQGGGEELYIPFFARRRPILLTIYRDRAGDLDRRLAAIIGAGEPVFVTSAVLGDPFWKDYFERLRPEVQAKSAEGFEVYRLAGATARPRGARRRS